MQVQAKAARPADLPQGRERSRMNRVAMKAFLAMMAEWGASVDEQLVLLGRPQRSRYYRWKKGEIDTLPDDTLERISCLLGIYKAIEILAPPLPGEIPWVRRPNALLDAQTPLGIMLGGRVDDLYEVRRFLDSWRG